MAAVHAGRWAKGVSGNPMGRPKAVRELIALARSRCPEAIELATGYVRDGDAEPKIRLEAAKIILNYGIGAPPKNLPEDDDEIEALTDDQLAAKVIEIADRYRPQ